MPSSRRGDRRKQQGQQGRCLPRAVEPLRPLPRRLHRPSLQLPRQHHSEPLAVDVDSERASVTVQRQPDPVSQFRAAAAVPVPCTTSKRRNSESTRGDDGECKQIEEEAKAERDGLLEEMEAQRKVMEAKLAPVCAISEEQLGRVTTVAY